MNPDVNKSILGTIDDFFIDSGAQLSKSIGNRPFIAPTLLNVISIGLTTAGGIMINPFIGCGLGAYSIYTGFKLTRSDYSIVQQISEKSTYSRINHHINLEGIAKSYKFSSIYDTVIGLTFVVSGRGTDYRPLVIFGVGVLLEGLSRYAMRHITDKNLPSDGSLL